MKPRRTFVLRRQVKGQPGTEQISVQGGACASTRGSVALKELVASLSEVEPLLTPTFLQEQIAPGTAIALLADAVYVFQTGNDKETPTELRILLCEMILGAWQQGHFIPSADFPYTLEQVIADAMNMHEDDEQ